MRHVLVVLMTFSLVIAATGATAQDVDGNYQGFGDPGGFWSIVPPGQQGVFSADEALAAQTGEPPEHADDQLGPYADIVYQEATPGFTADDLSTYFKDGSLGVHPDDIGRVYRPGERDDVTVIREESFDVPHVFGDTREGVMFGAGYTGAEDRLFLMDVLRHVGRAELTAFLGPSEGNIEMDREQMAVAPYTEEDLTAQVERYREGPLGEEVFADATAYVAGVNRYIAEALADPDKLPAEYLALQRTPDEFVLEDLVAIASLVGGIFGKGGGREVANHCGLTAMEQAGLSEQEARAVFDDFKFADDAEAPRTTDRSFPYLQHGEVDPAAHPEIDCDSLEEIEAPPPGPEHVGEAIVEIVPSPPLPAPQAQVQSQANPEPQNSRTGTIDFPWGSERIDLDMGLSNALLIAGDRTDNGNPIAVFGPQTGYFMPQLLVEKGLYGPGIAARGVAFAGVDLYIQLGRGPEYAFSATSAGADNTDQFVLELCDPEGGEATTDSMGYQHDGECVEIEEHQEVRIAQPSAGGVPDGQESFEEFVVNRYFQRAPDYGQITARGQTADGTPIAIATQRTTYLDELGSARGFHMINDPEVMADGFDGFRRAFGSGVDYTFNWFYVDDDEIGYQASCWCPERDPEVDPYLPAWGNGEWDWQGDLDRERLPWDRDPDDGYLVSWNNKQAPDFRSNDGQFGWGPIHRSDLLGRRIREVLSRGDVSVGEAVDVMALAATTDLRGQELVDLLLRALGDEAPPDADDRTERMAELLAAWADDDHGHRRDHDGDGEYEHAQAVAIMDAWWEPLVDAMFQERSADARRRLDIRLHDAPQNHLGSAFQDSMYAHVHKDLRQALGDDVEDRFHRTYCGGGDLGACRDALWGSLSRAAADLEQEFESSSVEDWQREPSDDEIRHTPVGVVEVPPIHWQNRPTYQQVVQVPVAQDDEPAPAPAPDDEPAPAPARDDEPALPTTGAGLASIGVIVLGLGALGTWRRRIH